MLTVTLEGSSRSPIKTCHYVKGESSVAGEERLVGERKFGGIGTVVAVASCIGCYTI